MGFVDVIEVGDRGMKLHVNLGVGGGRVRWSVGVSGWEI